MNAEANRLLRQIRWLLIALLGTCLMTLAVLVVGASTFVNFVAEVGRWGVAALAI